VNPYQDITDPKLAKALAHPLRTRVLAALEGRTASPSQLADELDVPLGVLSYHVRRLTSLGFLKLVKRVPRRGAVEHYYTTVARPRITDEAWAATPHIVKQATVSAALEQIGTFVNAAAAAGGFEATESHLSRTPITVDEKGWKAIARELSLMNGRIGKIEEESAKRLNRADHDGGQHATLVLMLFHSASPESANTHNDGQSTRKHVERRRTASTRAD
jgi:DNA-binding transcriptional ArsR family regulator